MTDHRQTIEQLLDDYNRHDAAKFASYFAEDGVLRILATGEVNNGRETDRGRGGGAVAGDRLHAPAERPL